ncbi:MAG: NTP transferase domain-containing protein, partial [Phycisphaerales bacterium]|nr:NTP transferase domain-containing protein [Phycisphaerales bacterium]
MESARFPGKALVADTGTPLVLHVVEQVRKAAQVDRILVAAPPGPIIDVVRDAGEEAIATRPDHPNGTSRIAEVAETLDADIIVNVQGDEPEIEPETIDAVIQALRDHPDCPMATVASPFKGTENPQDPNLVKVVLDQQGRALFFSRSLIPHHRDPGEPAAAGLL